MKKYTKHTSVVALLNRRNVDTDQIIAKQFLKKIDRSGFGKHLFNDWRFLEDGNPNPEFELNNPKFKNAKILLTGDNFGCGSSREHAPWAIEDYGFNTIISSSYADIFYNNCFKNGILPIIISEKNLQDLMQQVDENEGTSFTIDLQEQYLLTELGTKIAFEIDHFRKNNLLEGLDDIALTLKHVDKIDHYEQQNRKQYPWLWK